MDKSVFLELLRRQLKDYEGQHSAYFFEDIDKAITQEIFASSVLQDYNLKIYYPILHEENTVSYRVVYYDTLVA